MISQQTSSTDNTTTHHQKEFTYIQVKNPTEADRSQQGCETKGSSAEVGECFSYDDAKEKADELVQIIKPHCIRVEIAGSIRRKCKFVGDIEIVCIAKPYQTGLFSDGLAAVMDKYFKVKGELDGNCKYTQRLIPIGSGKLIKLDLFITVPEKWGLIFAIRTGSADFSKKLAARWVELGYHSHEGMLRYAGKSYPCYEESELFQKLGLKFIEPEYRL